MTENPIISVIMPVFNGERYLGEAMQSILGQTFGDFEFIIIDDGSEDGSTDIIMTYKKKDKRVILIKNEENHGIVFSLNHAITIARGKFVARMDCDDISIPDRFQVQTDYLEVHPDVGVIGSNAYIIDNSGKIIRQTHLPTEHDSIKWALLFNNALIHPTVMFRRSLSMARYSPKEFAKHAEDYELWLRLINHSRFQNLEQPLLQYRLHEERISDRFSGIQFENSMKISQVYISNQLNIDVPLEIIRLIRGEESDLLYETITAINTLCKIHEVFFRQEKLRCKMRNRINKDLANRLLRFLRINDSFRIRLKVLFWAFYYSPTLVFKKVLGRMKTIIYYNKQSF